MAMFAGLDVHSKQCTFVIQNGEGEVVASGQFETTPEGISQFVKKHELDGKTKVGMESGSVAPFVARRLIELGLDVKIIDAQEVRKKARRKKQKTDYSDAFEICEGIRRDIYVSVVELPDSFAQGLRDKLSERRHYIGARTREVLAVKGMLRKEGLGRLYRSMKSQAAFKKLLLLPQLTEAMKASVKRHQAQWTSADEQVKALDIELDKFAKKEQVAVERLQTVPGVGPIVAMTCMAYYCNPKRFLSAKHAASYSGLVPQTYSSADRETYGHITKDGPSELRAMLCEAAHHASRKNHPLNSFFNKLKAKKGYKVAIIAVAHRLARILWSMHKNETSFDLKKFPQSENWNALTQETSGQGVQRSIGLT
jgi:transposase